MKFRLILQGLAILLFLSSCSKELFLIPVNTGSYGGSSQTTRLPETPFENSLKENTEEIITATTGKENYPALNYSTAKHFAQIEPATSAPANKTKNNLSLKSIGKALKEKKVLSLENHSGAFVNRKAVPDTQAEANEKTGFIFGILSFLSGVAGVGLTILFSHFIFSLLGILAVICGLISLSKKEKFKGLAITGLILGFLGIILLIILLTFWDGTGGH